MRGYLFSVWAVLSALLTVGMFDVSSSSAKVVYQSDASPIGSIYEFPLPNSTTYVPPVKFTLDLNGDSVSEFGVSLENRLGQIQVLEEIHVLASMWRPEGSNASVLMSPTSPTPSSPAALPLGSTIGPEELFGDSLGGTLFRGHFRTFSGAAVPMASGNFLTANSAAYIGVRFLLNDEVRYGWVCLSFFGGTQGGLNPGRAIVYGLAYEDAGDEILAGQRSDWSTADFNRDGIVDGDDLVGWAGGVGDSDAHDADGDGDSDGNDFLLWQQQFGTNSFLPAAQPAALATPEPAGGLLAIVGATCGVFTRLRVASRRAGST